MNKRSFVILLIAALFMAFLFARDIQAGPGSCPADKPNCRTYEHKSNSNLGCFSGNAVPGQGWIYVEDGCSYLFPEPTDTAVVIVPTSTRPVATATQESPTATQIVVNPTSTQPGVNVTETPHRGEITETPSHLFQASVTPTCIDDCCTLIVEQLEELNKWQATQASAQSTLAAKP